MGKGVPPPATMSLHAVIAASSPMVRYVFEEGPRAQPHEIGDVLHHEPVSSWLRREEEKLSLRTMAGDAGGAGASYARSCPAHQ